MVIKEKVLPTSHIFSHRMEKNSSQFILCGQNYPHTKMDKDIEKEKIKPATDQHLYKFCCKNPQQNTK